MLRRMVQGRKSMDQVDDECCCCCCCCCCCREVEARVCAVDQISDVVVGMAAVLVWKAVALWYPWSSGCLYFRMRCFRAELELFFVAVHHFLHLVLVLLSSAVEKWTVNLAQVCSVVLFLLQRSCTAIVQVYLVLLYLVVVHLVVVPTCTFCVDLYFVFLTQLL